MSAVRERIPNDSCQASHKRASKLFEHAVIVPGNDISRLRYSTYGPLHDPEQTREAMKQMTEIMRNGQGVKRTASMPTGKVTIFSTLKYHSAI